MGTLVDRPAEAEAGTPTNGRHESDNFEGASNPCLSKDVVLMEDVSELAADEPRKRISITDGPAKRELRRGESAGMSKRKDIHEDLEVDRQEPREASGAIGGESERVPDMEGSDGKAGATGQKQGAERGGNTRRAENEWSEGRRQNTRGGEATESGEVINRQSGREAETPDWHRGKRGRLHEDTQSSGDDGRGRKRRKSEDGPALPLSPEESQFRMGAQGASDWRGSPKSVRDRRKGRNYQPPRAPSEEDQRATLYVGDLDQATSKRDLRNAFTRFGEIKESKMITGQCYGFVTFRSRASAESALKSASSIEVLGRKPYLSWAQGAMPAWKIGVGGFIVDPSVGILDKRDALSKAAEVAAATAAAVLAEQKKVEENGGKGSMGGRRIVAYDDLF